MGIQDFGFRGYAGKRTGAVSRVLAISKCDVAHAFRTKKFLVFFVLCISPAIFAFFLVYLRFIMIEGSGNLAGMDFKNPVWKRLLGRIDTVEFFVDFAKGMTSLLTLLFSSLIGAGIVSRDRHAGALEIYFTRGIRPMQYFAGKALGVFFLLIAQVLLPFLAVWIFGISVATAESGYWAHTAPLMPGIIAGQMVLCASLAFWMSALSISTSSARFALLRWAGGIFVLSAAARLLWRFFQDPTWHVISPWHVARRVAFQIAGASDWTGLEFRPALIAWLVLNAAAALWLARHLRPVEVVG